MKLGKKSWLFIGLGLFLIAFVSLWLVYSQQAEAKSRLKEELALARTRLSEMQIDKLSDEQGELEQQLETSMKQSESARETLSQPMNSLIISDILFSTAEANGVNITTISSSGANRVDLNGVPCQTLSLAVNIEGEVADLVDFITELNGDLTIATVKTVSLEIPYPAGVRKPTASIQMAVYTHEGS